MHMHILKQGQVLEHHVGDLLSITEKMHFSYKGFKDCNGVHPFCLGGNIWIQVGL